MPQRGLLDHPGFGMDTSSSGNGRTSAELVLGQFGCSSALRFGSPSESRRKTSRRLRGKFWPDENRSRRVFFPGRTRRGRQNGGSGLRAECPAPQHAPRCVFDGSRRRHVLQRLIRLLWIERIHVKTPLNRVPKHVEQAPIIRLPASDRDTCGSHHSWRYQAYCGRSFSASP